MKTGFLARKAAKQTSKSHPTQSAPEPAEEPASPPAAQPSGTFPAASDSQPQQEASWQQCLELLRSEVDEKKFVGLLLVTKLLPQANDTAVQQVLDAVGLTFIQRLLLPLHHTSYLQQQQQQSDEAKLQQQHLSVVLGLSILSVTCRLPAVSISEEILRLLPLLLKVAAAGGVAPVLLQLTQQQQQHPHILDHVHPQQNGGSDASSAAWADAASESAAAADALECVLTCVGSDSCHRAVGLECNALPLAVMTLQTALSTLSRSMYSSTSSSSAHVDAGEMQPAVVDANALRAVMLSVQLLDLLLSHSNAAAALAQQPGVATAAVMLLSRVFGADLGAHLGSSSGSSSSKVGNDAAALQLEAQHTLLLLLPLIQDSQAADLSQQAAAGVGEVATVQDPAVAAALVASGDWPAALRHGLSQLLRSRTGVVQRHSALQLAAAVTELLGHTWLLPSPLQHQQQQQHQQRQPPSSSTGSSSDPQQQLLLVLMEVLAIETPLLLSDAMNPEAVVPRANMSMTARSAAAAASQQQQQGDQARPWPTRSGDMDVKIDSAGDDHDSDHQGLAPEFQPLTVQQIMQQVQQQEALASSSSSSLQQQPAGPPGFQVMTPDQQKGTKSLQQRLAELQLPDEKAPGPQQQYAGTRAEQLLPACFQLLECCCDVLVSQADALEQPVQHDTAATAATAAAAAAAAAGDIHHVPVLGYKEVQQLMMRLQQVTQVLLEFLDYATSQPAAPTPVNPLLTAGAVRVLGRFLADAPDVHSEAVQKLLPQLLAVAVPREPTACGVSFLLPALLSWTSSSNGKQQQWVALLLAKGGKGLAELARYTASLAAAATAAGGANAANGGGGSSSSSTDVTALKAEMFEEGPLGTACQVLQQLLSSLPAVITQQGQQPPAKILSSLSGVVVKLLMPVLVSVSKWTSACLPPQHYRLGGSATPAAVALSLLQSYNQVPSRLPALMAAAAFTGRLLLLLASPSQSAAPAVGTPPNLAQHSDVASSAGQLLCFGCAAGWSCQVLRSLQDYVWQSSGQGGSTDTLQSALQQEGIQMDVLESIISWVEPIWEDAELGELWDVCLSTAAELTLAGLPAGLRDAFRSAAWVVAAKQTGHGAMSAVVVEHPELQMLLEAVGATGGVAA